MKVKKYLKEHSYNCLINGEKIDFQTTYSQYIELKKIGKQIIKEYKIKKIKISDNNIIIPIHFIDSNINLNSIVTNFLENNKDNFYNKNYIYNNINLAIIAHTITNALRLKLKEIENPININSVNFDIVISNIIEIQIKKRNLDNYKFIISELPIIFEKIGKNNPNYNMIDEKLCYEENNSLTNYLNFINIFSLFFHYLKLELVFYTHQIIYGLKPPKNCLSCHELHYSNTDLCPTCNKKRINDRRKANAKCKSLRKELNNYIEKYDDIISNEIKDKIDLMLKSNHEYTDLKELQYLKEIVEKELLT